MVRDLGLDVAFDNAFTQVDCAGSMSRRPLAFLADIDEDVIVARFLHLPVLVDIDFLDS